MHSTASDGSLPPKDILGLALDTGLKAIALTDHDTVEGVRSLLQQEIPDSIKLLTGVEISAAPPPSFKLPGSLHILGYGMNVFDKKLDRMLEGQQRARKKRIPAVISRLKECGIPASLEEIRASAGNQQVGRPQIAIWMAENGFAASVDDAFERYLGRGGPAYVEKTRTASADAIQQIRTAGGLAVLAHPGLIKTLDEAGYEQLTVELMSMGLQGIEAYYPRHSGSQRTFFESLAGKLGLLVTGGSDFHGAAAPDIKLGSGSGDLHVPYSIYESIINTLALNTFH